MQEKERSSKRFEVKLGLQEVAENEEEQKLKIDGLVDALFLAIEKNDPYFQTSFARSEMTHIMNGLFSPRDREYFLVGVLKKNPELALGFGKFFQESESIVLKYLCDENLDESTRLRISEAAIGAFDVIHNIRLLEAIEKQLSFESLWRFRKKFGYSDESFVRMHGVISFIRNRFFSDIPSWLREEIKRKSLEVIVYSDEFIFWEIMDNLENIGISHDEIYDKFASKGKLHVLAPYVKLFSREKHEGILESCLKHDKHSLNKYWQNFYIHDLRKFLKRVLDLDCEIFGFDARSFSSFFSRRQEFFHEEESHAEGYSHDLQGEYEACINFFIESSLPKEFFEFCKLQKIHIQEDWIKRIAEKYKGDLFIIQNLPMLRHIRKLPEISSLSIHEFLDSYFRYNLGEAPIVEIFLRRHDFPELVTNETFLAYFGNTKFFWKNFEALDIPNKEKFLRVSYISDALLEHFEALNEPTKKILVRNLLDECLHHQGLINIENFFQNEEKRKYLSDKDIVDVIFGNDTRFYWSQDFLQDLLMSRRNSKELAQKILEGNLSEGRQEEEWNAYTINFILTNFEVKIHDKPFLFCKENIGNFFSKKTYHAVKDIFLGKKDSEACADFCITESGDKALLQLRKKIQEMKLRMYNPNFLDKDLFENNVYLEIFKNAVRFSEAQFHGDNPTIHRIISNFYNAESLGEVKSLDPYYQYNLSEKVERLRTVKVEDFSDGSRVRYGYLKSRIMAAGELAKRSDIFSFSVKKIEEKISHEIKRLNDLLEKLKNPIARENVFKKILDLQNIKLRSLESFQENFHKICSENIANDDVLEMLFAYALRKVPDNQSPLIALRGSKSPSIEDMSRVVEFCEHVVVDMVWKRFFTQKEYRKTLFGIANCNALTDEIVRSQNAESRGFIDMEFFATRGILMEFSGHFSDACWAGKYGSIAKNFPNMFTSVFVQNKGTKYERIVGCSMFIETVAVDGTPLLVIRGLNPLENVINHLSARSFFTAFIKYANELAQRSGRVLAIVIDDHCGGSSTNRPVMYELLASLRSSLEKVTLKSPQDTTFNGYNIVNETYFVSEELLGDQNDYSYGREFPGFGKMKEIFPKDFSLKPQAR